MIADWSVNELYKSLFFIAILFAFTVAGCTSVPPGPEAPYDYSVKGRIGVRNDGAGHSANFKWQQLGTRYNIEVWGPLGQGRTVLEGDQRFMVISRGGEIVARGHPADVMFANLGWSLPVDVLSTWLLGAADESEPFSVTAVDADGRVTELRQLGWQVTFDRFPTAPGDLQPRRIKARRGGEAITVVVSDFEQ